MIGLYTYRTNNIGDDFQSYVLARYLRAEIGYVWRDGASNYTGPVTNLIVNGFITKEALPITPSLRPIFLAAWLGPRVMDDPEKVDFLSEHTPIGCRDTETLERCRERNIPAHFTGCPSILCEPLPEYEEVVGSIAFVDVDPRLFESVGPHYRKQTALSDSVDWVSNIVPFDLSVEQRWAECRKRHELLSRSETIVTNRIHAALPALGMGKAVIFVNESIANSGRLTALPENVKTWSAAECAGMTLNPADHRYEINSYQTHVKKTLDEQCGEVIRRHRN